jgi:hypothetical protein
MTTESNMESVLSSITDLSFGDKITLMNQLSLLIKKEAKSGVIGKAMKKERKQRDPDAPKKESAPGTKAWRAYVSEIKEKHPEILADCEKEPERLKKIGEYKDAHLAAYEKFVDEFISGLTYEEQLAYESSKKKAAEKASKKESSSEKPAKKEEPAPPAPVVKEEPKVEEKKEEAPKKGKKVVKKGE